MNKRIRELAVKCGAWNQVYNNKEFMVDRTFQVEKFAELIIQDCIDVVDGYTKPRTFNTHYDAVEQIKHLFGIE
jgi:hypothetical protein